MTDSKQNEDDTRRDAVMEELRAARERLAAQRNCVDALVVSADDVARYRDSHALVVKPALREGRTVYESARARGAGEAQ